MSIEKYNYRGDTNIGFYATITNEYAVLPHGFEHEQLPEKQVEVRISGTRLIGLFTEGNSNCLLVPDSAKEREIEKLEESGLNVHVLNSNETALGNLILANDKGAVISPRLSDHKDEISNALGVDVEISDIAGIPNPGVCAVANSKGAVIHRDASEEDAELVKETLGIEEIDIGTINMGSPYMGSGALVTDQVVLVGRDTTGPEVGRLDRVLVEH